MVVFVKILEKKFDTRGVNNAILSGLVAVTAGAPLIEPEGAFVVGVVAAVVYYTSANLLLKLQIDDVVDAVGFSRRCLLTLYYDVPAQLFYFIFCFSYFLLLFFCIVFFFAFMFVCGVCAVHMYLIYISTAVTFVCCVNVCRRPV